MKRKSQPRPPRRSGGGRTTRAVSARPRGRMARRPGVPLRRRIGARVPPLSRVGAVLAAAACAGLLVWLVVGDWLRVDEVRWDGEAHTPAGELEAVLEGERGASILAVDTTALVARLEALPAVAEARVTASLTGALNASLVEREAAFIWDTSTARLIGAEDGTLFAVTDRAERLAAGLRDLPHVVDERHEARVLAVGDRIPGSILRTAMSLTALDPVELGSAASRLRVQLDDNYGFKLASADPEWQIAFGAYGLDPRETPAFGAGRLERQVTAVRTLFASRAEADISWVDVRNPGKVYFRAKG